MLKPTPQENLPEPPGIDGIYMLEQLGIAGSVRPKLLTKLVLSAQILPVPTPSFGSGAVQDFHAPDTQDLPFMKFARTLKDSQIPEWQKAYIDYRGLKKLIAEIRKAEVTSATATYSVISPRQSRISAPPRVRLAGDASDNTRHFQDVIDISAQAAAHLRDGIADRSIASTTVAANDTPCSTKRMSRIRHSIFSISPVLTKRRARGLSLASIWSDVPWKANPLAGLSLSELYKELDPLQIQFFEMLDAELEKVDSFYTSKENELQARTQVLVEQFKELNEHRHIVYKARPSKTPVWKRTLRFVPTNLVSDEDTIGERFSRISMIYPGKKDLNFDTVQAEPRARRAVIHSSNPGDYLQAKKELKKAVLEHYRAIEALRNYRVLNVTGFRKALKKFQKYTQIPAQQQYMSEKVDRSSLASDKTIRVMMQDMEERYGESFFRGNIKKARDSLRSGPRATTHYIPTFKSGICLGMALPALLAGIYLSFQPHIRQEIRGWDTLLYIYGVFLIPIIFSILITLNLIVWAQFRINYVFIFELNSKSYIDYREYLELPSWLFTGLCYAFFFTFSRVGYPGISPSYWLFVWLGFATILVFNPLPIWVRSSRVWFLKTLGRVVVSGVHPVEFSDFWLADQLCSFTFTLSNIPVFACAYSVGFQDEWDKCGSSSRFWPSQYVLVLFPFLARFIQSLRRYYESGLPSHLVNAGKYGTGMISYFFYYLWRASGGGGNSLMAIWCMFSTAYAIYASAWDTLVDWSLLKSHSMNRFLREDLVYPSNNFYYLAIGLNFILRFTWVAYIPQNGLDPKIRAFIIAFLEMLRRWQWNLLRLENEHIGNIDQYRITREMPLPYSYEDRYENDEADEEGEEDGDVIVIEGSET